MSHFDEKKHYLDSASKNVSRETLVRETIFAVATPPGRSAVAIIRISGVNALMALQKLTRRTLIPPRQACLLNLYEFPAENETATKAKNIIDQALLLYFPAPASETGEDCLELQTHGSPNVLMTLCRLLANLPNFRLAEPGEFIRRAFYHGKLDLSAIEGVADLLASDTDEQRRQALRLLQGELRRKIADWRQDLLRALAYIEATIDFVGEELPGNLVGQAINLAEKTNQEIKNALATSHQGEILRDGYHIALIGAPNAGKSTLLNHFAAREAAIVSPQPGTTRDAISVELDWAGYRVTVTDTAGIRPSDDEIELIGMKRSREWAEKADLTMILCDSVDLPKIPPEIHKLIEQNPDALLIASKMDLNPNVNWGGYNVSRETFELSLPPDQPALPQQYTEKLIDKILTRIRQSTQNTENSIIITRARHQQALAIASTALTHINTQQADEIIAESLRQAVLEMDKITGRVAFDDMMSLIFGEFCLGK